MTQASVRLAQMDDDVSIVGSDMRDETIRDVSGNRTASPPRSEIETLSTSGKKKGTNSTQKTRGRGSRTSKRVELDSLEDRMEERLRQNIETRFSSFEDRIMGLLSKKLDHATSTVSQTVTRNTLGGCFSPVQTTSQNCTLGASSMRNIIPLENSLNDELLRPVRQNVEDDLVSLQPGQNERQSLGLDSQHEDSHSVCSQSECVVETDNNKDSRFIKYKSIQVTEDSQNRLSEAFGEDAHTDKSNTSSGIVLDKCQTETLSQSWRTEQPDKLTAYKENFKSSFPLNEKTEEFLKVPSLDDIVETFLIKRFSNKACFKRARSLHTQHLKEMERLAYQTQVAAKQGIAANLYMQQALRVLLEELKSENPNLDLAVQTVRDVFAISTKTLDQLGRTGAHAHMICRKATIVDMGLENVRDLSKQADLLPLTHDGVLGTAFESKLKDRKEKNKEMKDLIPELEPKKTATQSYKRKAYTGNQYGDKHRRYNNSSKNFNNKSYSGEYRSPLKQLYGNFRSNYSYRGAAQQRKSGVSSFRNKNKQ